MISNTKKIKKIVRSEIRKTEEEAVVIMKIPCSVQTNTAGKLTFWFAIDPYMNNTAYTSIANYNVLTYSQWGSSSLPQGYQDVGKVAGILRGSQTQRMSHTCRVQGGYNLYQSATFSEIGTPYDNTGGPIDLGQILGSTMIKMSYVMAPKGRTDTQLETYMAGLPHNLNVYDPDVGFFDQFEIKLLKQYVFHVGPNIKPFKANLKLPTTLAKQHISLRTDDDGETENSYYRQRKIYLLVQVQPGGQFTWTSPTPDVTLRIIPRMHFEFRNVYSVV